MCLLSFLLLPATISFTPYKKLTSFVLPQVAMVLTRIPAGIIGSLQMFLCPDGRAAEECLDR